MSAEREELFDLSAEYESMLNQGIRLSGENREFFVEGRLQAIKTLLPALAPKKILDFGCGIGGASKRLSEVFPTAVVVGVDTSENALAWATEHVGSGRVQFRPLESLDQQAPEFDLCHVNGVFHHIVPQQRPGAIRQIHSALIKGGMLALFENNPWNPGARLVMSRIPFDRDAIMLSPPETAGLLREGGFSVQKTKSFFYFPRQLAFARPAEKLLTHLPLGAQYLTLGQKL